MRKSILLKKIIHVLQKYPEARDSDKKLYVRFWKEYFPEYFNEDNSIQDGAIEAMTHADDLTRLRAYIQNDLHLFLSTSEEVRKKRRQSQADWTAWVKIMRNKTNLQETINKL